jgi:hydroxymethylpyrimidine pyrophosphatase-like HAD family hydrolase
MPATSSPAGSFTGSAPRWLAPVTDMALYYRALAVDYDGTLTSGPSPDPEVLTHLAEARARGLLLVLVTGRRWRPLVEVFPRAEGTFDAMVVENGAVLWTPAAGLRPLAQPVPAELDPALRLQGVPFARGDVLLDTECSHDQIILREIGRLGLDVQLVRNRQALMLLPPGVTKGTGLLEALRELGVSPHSTVAIGDAENDYALLETCELGVAVANAVPALQAHADVVLAQPAGAGVSALLAGPLFRGEIRVQPTRWRARLGAFDDGTPATVPGSQVNLLVTGGSRSGKSCLAGLLAEKVALMGYSLCVIDPEGDHTGLAALPRTVVVGGAEWSPDDPHLGQLLRVGNVVVDLSLVSSAERAMRCRQMLRTLALCRERTGTPHWIMMDEAHLVPDVAELLGLGARPAYAGLCLATYRPDLLAPATLGAMDYAVAFPGSDLAALERAGFGRTSVEEPAAGGPHRRAILLDRASGRRFIVDRRVSTHVRHWHKYWSGELPMHRRFFFRNGDRLTGAVAAGVGDFHAEIARADPGVLAHHAAHQDLSRWLEGVIGDVGLAADVRRIETALAHGMTSTVEGRRLLLQAVEARYAPG